MTPPSPIETQSAEGQFDGSPRKNAGAPQKPSAWQDAALALSIAHLSFIQSVYGLLIERTFGYFNRVPVNRPSLAALLANIFGVGCVLWVMGRLIRQVNHRALFGLASLVVCAMVLIPLNFARTHFWNFGAAKLAMTLKQPLVMIGILIVVVAALWFHRRTAKVIMGIYIVLSPMVLFTAGKCVWYLIKPPPAAEDSVTPLSGATTNYPRVVWLLLDELDQRIAFEARPPDIPMPELTRLYHECFHATNAFPPGGSTAYSLPALTIGREIRGASAISASELAINGSGRWSQAETVFSRARSLGFSTALVGWFHPYGRVLGNHLDRCAWYPYPPFELERGRTFSEAALNQLCSVFSQFQQRRLHVRNVLSAQKAALDALTLSPAGLTMLHLPVPHHPGIYDPKREQFTLWKYSRSREYLENLVLADKVFGMLRRLMEQTGAWDQTWLIVSSDHWWRESAHYDGKTDHRVPFIIKAPGPNQPTVYEKKLSTVLTYHLILSILKGELSNANELPHWLNTYRIEPPSGYRATGEPL